MWGRVLRQMDARQPNRPFIAAASRHVDDLPVQLVLAAHLQRAGEREAAGRTLEAAAVRHDTVATAHIALAALYRSSGQTEAAEAATDELLRRFPAVAEAQLVAGLVSLGGGREEEALERLRRSVELAPEAVAPRVHLAYLLLLLGEAEW